jgi:hypothetical protein
MRVLHLAPHPDDEILGAGTTPLALIGAGHEPVGRAAVRAIGERAVDRPRLWLWSLWLALPPPEKLR